MCTAVGGGSRTARVGRAARSGIGRAQKRQSQTRSRQSVFQAGDYKVRNTRRYESGRESGRTYDSDWTHVRINSQKEKRALMGGKLNIRARGSRNGDIDYDNNKFDYKYSVNRWQEASYKGQSTSATRASDIRRKGNSPEFKNEMRANKQNRVAVADESSARRKTRGARVHQRKEVGYRSRRKGAAQATNGLRIGGSGVNVPGSS